MKTIISRYNKTIIYYSAAFLLSLLIGIAMFISKGIAPFGTQSLLSMDLWGQYFPMYVQFSKTSSISDLLHSWNGAFGYNNWAQNAYYCNSLFFWFFKLIPLKYMVTALNIEYLLKIGLSAVSACYFLTYKEQKRSPIFVAGSVAYSLCAYMLSASSQSMWSDELFLFPVLLVGLEALIVEKKWKLYTFSLAACIWANFYIGFSICVFCVLYYLCIYLVNSGKNKDVTFLSAFFRFALFSLLGGLLTGAVIVPTALALFKTASSEQPLPNSVYWYTSIWRYFRNLLPAQALVYGYKTTNIYSGIMIFFLFPMYLLNTKITRKERIVYFSLIVFLFISMNNNILDYIWHGFHYPNHFPGRWTFAFSLIIIWLSCRGLIRISTLSLPGFMISVVSGSALIILSCMDFGGQDTFHMPVCYIPLIILCVISIVFLTSFIPSGLLQKKKIALYACTLLLLADTAINTIIVANDKVDGVYTSNGVSYTDKLVSMDKIGDFWRSKKNDFYRVQAHTIFTFNSSMTGNYKGISYYSSTMQGSVYNFLKSLGNRVYGDKVSSVYNYDSPIQDSLFGIKYFIDFVGNLNSKVPGIDLAYNGNGYKIWENDYYLPIGYRVSSDMITYETSTSPHYLRSQEALLSAACGEPVEVFHSRPYDSFTYDNCTLRPNESNWDVNWYDTTDLNQDCTFTYLYTCQEDGPVFIENNFRAGSISVSSAQGTSKSDAGSSHFFSLGTFQAGDQLEVTITASKVTTGCYGIEFYLFDKAAMDHAYQILSQDTLEVTNADNTTISGVIHAPSKEVMLTTIAQDGGWEVTCDSKKADTILIADSLIAVIVPQGTHTLQFRYHVPGLKTGMLISFISLIILIWIFLRSRSIIDAES